MHYLTFKFHDSFYVLSGNPQKDFHGAMSISTLLGVDKKPVCDFNTSASVKI